ncbi:hypothetical protein EB118_16040 [bacterium]|nr:hypothetical protein [bacterium]
MKSLNQLKSGDSGEIVKISCPHTLLFRMNALGIRMGQKVEVLRNGWLKDDNPEQECLEWFWVTLGEDEVYPKEFLEYLMQLVDDIETGKEELIPMDEDFMNRLKDLVKDVELDDDDNEFDL